MIIAKAIDLGPNPFLISTSNGLSFISFSYSVYENFDTETSTWDNQNLYLGFSPLNTLSYKIVNDIDQNKTIYLSLSLGDSTFTFSEGEYLDSNGDPFNISEIQAQLGGILS